MNEGSVPWQWKAAQRRLKESNKNIFYAEQKNSDCNIKCFKKLLTSAQKIDL